MSSNGGSTAATAAPMPVAATVEEFLSQYKSEIELLPNGKIRCLVTGTDMPKRLEIMQSFWHGRSYRQGKKQLEEEQRPFDLTPYAPHIISHKRLGSKVYCRRTKRILNKDVQEIEKHMKGRRFLFAMTTWKPRPEKKAVASVSDLKTGSDDIWNRMPGVVADVEGDGEAGEDDPDAEDDEEMDIERALRRQVKGEDEESDEEGEDEDEEDEEMSDGDGIFEEVPMDLDGSTRKGRSKGDDDDEEDEDDDGELPEDDNDDAEPEEEDDDARASVEADDAELEEPPKKKAKKADIIAAPAPSKPTIVSKGSKSMKPGSSATPSSAATASASKVETQAARSQRKEDSKAAKLERAAQIAAKSSSPTPSTKKQKEDTKPIGPPSKRDLKKEYKGKSQAQPNSSGASSTAVATPSEPSSSVPQPSLPQRLSIAEKRKLKKQQQKATGKPTTTQNLVKDEQTQPDTDTNGTPTDKPPTGKQDVQPTSTKQSSAPAGKKDATTAAAGAKRKRA